MLIGKAEVRVIYWLILIAGVWTPTVLKWSPPWAYSWVMVVFSLPAIIWFLDRVIALMAYFHKRWENWR